MLIKAILSFVQRRVELSFSCYFSIVRWRVDIQDVQFQALAVDGTRDYSSSKVLSVVDHLHMRRH